mgnify:FL=1
MDLIKGTSPRFTTFVYIFQQALAPPKHAREWLKEGMTGVSSELYGLILQWVVWSMLVFIVIDLTQSDPSIDYFIDRVMFHGFGKLCLCDLNFVGDHFDMDHVYICRVF